jgi:hypothetical protein
MLPTTLYKSHNVRPKMAKNLNTATPSAAKNVSKKAAAAAAANLLKMNHAETIEGDDFASLLAELGAVDEVTVTPAVAANEPVIAETAALVIDVPETPALTNEALEAAISNVEAGEAMVAAASVDAAPEGAVPTDGEIAGAAEVEKAAKTPRTPRIHYSDKVERLQARMGEQLGEYSVLTTADALVDEAQLAVVVDRTLEIMRAMNSKEKNRASNFIEWLSGKKAKLNNVLERVLTVLARDGFVTTGNEGNVFKDLLARPYSPASARAMGGNTVGMFTDLKVIMADGKGRFVANPDSLLLMKAQSMLSAAPVATAATPVAAWPSDAAMDSAIEEIVALAGPVPEAAPEPAAEDKLMKELEEALL